MNNTRLFCSPLRGTKEMRTEIGTSEKGIYIQYSKPLLTSHYDMIIELVRNFHLGTIILSRHERRESSRMKCCIPLVES